jgi:hypothetical protein
MKTLYSKEFRLKQQVLISLSVIDPTNQFFLQGIPTVDVQNILFKHFYKGRNEEPPSAVHSLVEKTLSLALCCLVKQANIENMLQKHMAASEWF